MTALLNTSGKAVVEYTYDAWGNPLTTTGTMASTLGEANFLRYRGYVYDNETGYYHLQSRYYNPELGRFINADDELYLGSDRTLLGYHLFTYCDNDPVNKVDPTGHWSWKSVFIGAAIVTAAAVAVIAVVASGGSAAPPLLAAVSAAVGTSVSAGAVATVATGVALTGFATMGAALNANIYESNNTNKQYRGKSIYNKDGERIDYEYYGNGNGNVHYDGVKGKEVLWRLENGLEKVYTVSNAVKKIIRQPAVQKAISRAIDIVKSLAGIK